MDEGRILNVAGGTIILSYAGDRLNATLEISSGEQLTVSQSGIISGQWYSVALGVKAGNFYLAVDTRKSVASLGGANIEYGATSQTWLTMGDGFKGEVSGLRIYDWDSPPLLTAVATSGVYNEDGKAQARIEVSEPFQRASTKLPAISVAINKNDSAGAMLNVLSNSLVKGFASSYLSVEPQSELDSDAVLQAMPMDDLFPDPRRGASGLVQRFALRSNSEAAAPNVLANFAWLSYESRYAELRNKVVLLQRTFVDQGQPELASYAAEYLQEATVKASYGDPFWLHAMATSLTVWAEMAEIRPDTAAAIGKAIGNRTDFWSWVRVLSLPANGWITDSIPIPPHDRTCDEVTPDVNVGTLLEYSSRSCRATGGQMAAMLEAVIDVDSEIAHEPELLTVYMTTILSSLKQMPLEYKKLFPPINASFAKQNNFEFVPEAHAAVWFYVVRGLAIAVKQAIRKGGAAAPANFIAFMQGGTSSRVTRKEMLITLAYLGTRLEDAPACSGCKKLNQQVSETVVQDIATWMAGLGLAKNGAVAEEDIDRKNCTVSNNAHGKAFELLATASYHALYEFGSAVGASNAAKYEILLSDPRTDKDTIKVGLMFKENDKYKHYDNSPHQRKPDLILAGEGPEKREWVELKSWRYNAKYLTKGGNGLDKGRFPLWNGFSKSETDKKGKSKTKYTMNAHRQHFLDYVATKDKLMDDYWEKEGKVDFKPAKYRTWFQVWEPGIREWTQLKKVNNRYVLGDKKETINVATPWIGKDDVTKGIVRKTTPQFEALQRYLNSAPEKMKAEVFEDSIGYKREEHSVKYSDGQISKGFSDFSKASVVPFTVNTFFALELGEQGANDIWKKLLEEFGKGEFAELQAAIDSGAVSKEQVEQLREDLTEKMLELLGPVKYLTMDIPILSDVEDAVADVLMGEEVEALRKYAAEFELNEEWFENACEAP